jgi:hypothetical protein
MATGGVPSAVRSVNRGLGAVGVPGGDDPTGRIFAWVVLLALVYVTLRGSLATYLELMGL